MKPDTTKKLLQVMYDVYEFNLETNRRIEEIMEETANESEANDPEKQEEAPKKESDPQEQSPEQEGQLKKSPESPSPTKKSESENSSAKEEESQPASESQSAGQSGKITSGSATPGTPTPHSDTPETIAEKIKAFQEAVKAHKKIMIPNASGQFVEMPIEKMKGIEVPDFEDRTAGDGGGGAEVAPAGKIWCGVCRKYHTRGTHD